MIPIKVRGDLKDYDAQVKRIEETLENAITTGYIRNKHEITVAEIRDYYKTLTPAQQQKYIKAVGYTDIKKLDKFNPDDKKNAPIRMLDSGEISLLTMLKNDFKNIVYAKGDSLRTMIDTYKSYIPLNSKKVIDKDSDIYQTVYYIFVTNGYENKGFKDAVWKVTNLRVCPYCNRTYIPLIRWEEDGSSIKGQLDHFYPKEKYPYLAVSLYNLVPSCTYCNGTSCKGSKDPYTEGIVNPFTLKDHRGLRFRLANFYKEILDLDKCTDSIELDIDTSLNSNMANNDRIFHIKDIYSYHKDIAAEIIFKHKASMSLAYQDFLSDITKTLVSPWTMKDFFKLYWGVPLEEEKLGERPMSKFTLDLINDLNERYAGRCGEA